MRLLVVFVGKALIVLLFQITVQTGLVISFSRCDLGRLKRFIVILHIGIHLLAYTITLILFFLKLFL